MMEPPPVVGRDSAGRLRIFEPEAMHLKSTLPGARGWARTASFDGLSSSQRAPVAHGARYGPGPEQFACGVGDVHQTWRPRPEKIPITRLGLPPPRVAGLTKKSGSYWEDRFTI
jgi:hypothetical protein